LEGFCDSDHVLVDVMDDSALFVDCAVEGLIGLADLLKFLAEFRVGLLETLPVAGIVTADLAEDKADGGGTAPSISVIRLLIHRSCKCS
jgi:hypothetical protein